VRSTAKVEASQWNDGSCAAPSTGAGFPAAQNLAVAPDPTLGLSPADGYDRPVLAEMAGMVRPRPIGG
jgi:hypothetical protein